MIRIAIILAAAVCAILAAQGDEAGASLVVQRGNRTH